MKIIITVIILSMLFSISANASEIFGSISTNPNTPSGDNPPVEEPLITVPAPVIKGSGGAVIMPVKNEPAVELQEVTKILPKAAVLGEKIFSDGTLVKAPDGKIYLIEGQTKKHIMNLKELEKYRGHAIIKATAEQLSDYRTRDHAIGELIRQKGEVKIYVIIKGSKWHILNLAELRARYAGLEIFNVSREQIALY